MSSPIIVQSNPGRAAGPGAKPAEPPWRSLLARDIEQRVRAHPSGAPAGPLTVYVARMAQTTPSLDEAGLMLSALRADPGAVLLFSGQPAERVVAHGLWDVARRAATAEECSMTVRKTVSQDVLGLFYEAGERQPLIEAARDPSAPSELAASILACMAQHRDAPAILSVLDISDSADLYRAQGLAHSPPLYSLARKLLRHLAYSPQK
ncbi:MAG: hypothetical protein KGH63_00535 [Candidatus Micrarchaeota archaeon]|nr:hypothetical protein [Candidatus Micrarchaeota archaeon]